MLKVVVVCGKDFPLGEVQKGGFRVSHQDGGMGGDNELPVLRHHNLDGGNQSQLADGRKWSLRFIKQVQAVWHETRLKQGQDTLSMRAGIEPFPLTLL